MYWFGLDKCQVPTKTTLSLPLLNWTGERKYDERLVGRDKDRERSLTHQLLSRTKHTELGRKGSLIHHQSNQNRIKRTKSTSSNTSPPASLLPGLNFTPVSLPPPPEWHRGTGNGGCGQFITCCLCRSFLFRGRTPHTLHLLQREVPLTGDSSPQTSSACVLPTGCSSS